MFSGQQNPGFGINYDLFDMDSKLPQPTPATDCKTDAWPFATFFSPAAEPITGTRHVLEQQARTKWIVGRDVASYLSQDMSVSKEFGQLACSGGEDILLDRYLRDAKHAVGPPVLESSSELRRDQSEMQQLQENKSNTGPPAIKAQQLQPSHPQRSMGALGQHSMDVSPTQPLSTETPFVAEHGLLRMSLLHPGSTPQQWRGSLFTACTETPDENAGPQSSGASLRNSCNGSAAELAADSQLVPSNLYYSDMQVPCDQLPWQTVPIANHQPCLPVQEVQAQQPTEAWAAMFSTPIATPANVETNRQAAVTVPDIVQQSPSESDPTFPQGLPAALLETFHALQQASSHTSPHVHTSQQLDAVAGPSASVKAVPGSAAPAATEAGANAPPPWKMYSSAIQVESGPPWHQLCAPDVPAWNQHPVHVTEHAEQEMLVLNNFSQPQQLGSHPGTPGQGSAAASPAHSHSAGSHSHGSVSLQQFVQHASASPSRAPSPDTPGQLLYQSPTVHSSGSSSEDGSNSPVSKVIPVSKVSQQVAAVHLQPHNFPVHHMPSPPSVNQPHCAIAQHHAHNRKDWPTIACTTAESYPLCTPQSSIVRQGFIGEAERSMTVETLENGVVEQACSEVVAGVKLAAAVAPSGAVSGEESSENGLTFPTATIPWPSTAGCANLAHEPVSCEEPPTSEQQTTNVKWYTPPEWAVSVLDSSRLQVSQLGTTSIAVDLEPHTVATKLDLSAAILHIQHLSKENATQKKQIQTLQTGMATYQQQLSRAVTALEECESTKQNLQQLLAVQLKETQFSQMQLQQLQLQLEEKCSMIEQLTVANSSPRRSSICSRDFASFGLGLHQEGPEPDAPVLAQLLDGLLELQGKVLGPAPSNILPAQPRTSPADMQKVAESVTSLTNMVRTHLATSSRQGYAASVGELDDDLTSTLLRRSSSQNLAGEWPRSSAPLDSSTGNASQQDAAAAQQDDTETSYLSSSHDAIQASPLAEALKKLRTGGVVGTAAATAESKPQDAGAQAHSQLSSPFARINRMKWEDKGPSADVKGVGSSSAQSEGHAPTSPMSASRPPIPGHPFKPNTTPASKQPMDMYLESVEMRCCIQQLTALTQDVGQSVCTVLHLPSSALELHAASNTADGVTLGHWAGDRCDGSAGKVQDGTAEDGAFADVKQACQSVAAKLRAVLSILQHKQADAKAPGVAELMQARQSMVSVSTQVTAPSSLLDDLTCSQSLLSGSYSDLGRELRVKQLTAKIDALEHELEEKRELCMKQSDRTRELMDSKQEVQAELDKKVRRISELEVCISKQQRDLALKDKAADDLRSFCADLTHKLEWRDTSLKELQDAQKALEEQLQHKEELELQLQQKLEDLNLQMQGQDAAASQLRQDMAIAQSSLSSKEQELQELQSNLTNLQHEVQSLEGMASTLQNEKAHLQYRLDEKESLLENLEQDKIQLCHKVQESASAAASTHELQQEVSQLQSLLAAKDADLQRLNEQVCERQKRIAEMSAANAALTAELQSAQQIAQQLGARVQQLEATSSSMAELQAEMASLAEDLSSARTRCDELQAQLSQVLTELAECRTARDVAQVSAEQRLKELNTTQALCDKLQHQVLHDEKKIDEQQQHLEAANSMLVALEDQLSHAAGKCGELEVRLEGKEQEVARLMKALQDVQAAAGSATDMAVRSEDRVSELQQQLSAAENESMQHKARNAKLMVEMEGMEHKLGTQEQDAQLSKSHIQQLEAKLETIGHELHTVQLRCKDLEQELSSQQQQLLTWQQESQASSNDASLKDTMLHQQAAELAGLHADAALAKELLAQLQAAREKGEQLQQQLVDMSDSNMKLKEQVRGQKIALERMEASLGMTHGQEDIIAELRHSVLSQDLINTRLRNQVEDQQREHKQEKGQLQDQLGQASGQLQKLQELHQEQQQKLQVQQQQLQEQKQNLEKQQQQLQEQEQKLEKQQQQLQEQKEELEEQQQQMQEQQQELQHHEAKDRSRVQLEADLQAAQAGLEELEHQLDQRDMVIAGLQKDLLANQASARDLAALTEKFERLESQLDNRNVAIHELKQELKQSQVACTEAHSKLSTSADRVTKLEHQLQSGELLMAELHNDLCASKSSNAQLTAQVEQTKALVTQLEEQLQHSVSRADALVVLEKSLEDKNEAILHAEAELGSAKALLQDLNTELQKRDAVVSHLESQLWQLQSQQLVVGQLQQQLQRSSNAIQELEAKLQEAVTAQAAVRELQKQLSLSQDTKKELEEQLEEQLQLSEEHGQARQQLLQQLDEHRQQVEQLQGEATELQARLAELGQTLDSRNILVTRMEADAHAQAAAAAQLQAQLDSQLQASRELDAKLQSTLLALAGKEQVVNELESKLPSLEVQLASKEHAIAELEQRVQAMLAELTSRPAVASCATQCTQPVVVTSASQCTQPALTTSATQCAQPLLTSSATQCNETAAEVERLLQQARQQEAEVTQLARQLLDAAAAKEKLSSFVVQLQQENEDLGKQLRSSELAVSELHSVMHSLQKQMAGLEAAASLRSSRSSNDASSHDTCPQQDQDAGSTQRGLAKQNASGQHVNSTANGIVQADLKRKIDFVATLDQPNSSGSDAAVPGAGAALSGGLKPPSAATPTVRPVVADEAADWILSLISGLETEQEAEGVQKLKERLQTLESTLRAVERHQVSADSQQSSLTHAQHSKGTESQYIPGAASGPAGTGSDPAALSREHSGSSSSSHSMQGAQDRLPASTSMPEQGTGEALEMWVQRAEQLHQAVLALQDECRQYQQLIESLSTALEQEQQSCRALQEQNRGLRDEVKNQHQLQEVTQSVLGQLEDNIRKVDSLKEVQDENAALRRGLHVITDYVRKLRTRTTTTVACSPITTPRSAYHASSPMRTDLIRASAATWTSPTRTADGACQCELLPAHMPQNGGQAGADLQALVERRGSNAMAAASGAAPHSPTPTDGASSSEYESSLWEQLRTAVLRSASTCKIELEEGNGGRQWLLASAIQMLRAQKNEIKRMVWTVKQLGPHGALVQGTSQLKQQYEALLAKHSALQAAHQQLEATVQKLSEENSRLVDVIRDQQQMLMSARSTPLGSGRLSPEVQGSAPNSLHSLQSLQAMQASHRALTKQNGGSVAAVGPTVAPVNSSMDPAHLQAAPTAAEAAPAPAPTGAGAHAAGNYNPYEELPGTGVTQKQAASSTFQPYVMTNPAPTSTTNLHSRSSQASGHHSHGTFSTTTSHSMPFTTPAALPVMLPIMPSSAPPHTSAATPQQQLDLQPQLLHLHQHQHSAPPSAITSTAGNSSVRASAGFAVLPVSAPGLASAPAASAGLMSLHPQPPAASSWSLPSSTAPHHQSSIPPPATHALASDPWAVSNGGTTMDDHSTASSPESSVLDLPPSGTAQQLHSSGVAHPAAMQYAQHAVHCSNLQTSRMWQNQPVPAPSASSYSSLASRSLASKEEGLVQALISRYGAAGTHGGVQELQGMHGRRSLGSSVQGSSAAAGMAQSILSSSLLSGWGTGANASEQQQGHSEAESSLVTVSSGDHHVKQTRHGSRPKERPASGKSAGSGQQRAAADAAQRQQQKVAKRDVSGKVFKV